MENIQKTVTDFYKIKVGHVQQKRRPIARPRQIADKNLAKGADAKASSRDQRELFGGRDHTTVLHAVQNRGRQQRTSS